MEYTTANPFIPKASVIRYANAVFEARIHLPGAAAHIDVVPHENFIVVTGSLSPRVRIDSEGKPSALVFTDQPCGVFGRDIPVNLTAGTELVVISAHQDCDDYIVRYTIRNCITPRANCADMANAAAGMAGCHSPPIGVKANCGMASAGIAVGPGHLRPQAGSCHAPPAVLGRGPSAYGGLGYGHAYAGYEGYAGYNHGFAHSASLLRGAGLASHPGSTHFHPNGGATF